MANDKQIDNAKIVETTPDDQGLSWKSRTYFLGTMMGGIMGLLSAYLFARAAQENEDEHPPKIATGTLISVLLAALGLMRQIAESGKQKKK